MPALTSITVDDRESTPVSHTYNPTTPKGNVWNWVNSDGVPIGDEQLSLSITKTPSGKYKVRWKLADPVVVTETINGVDRPSVERTAYAEIHFTFDEDSSAQERKNLVGKTYNLLASGQAFTTSVNEDLEGVY